MGYWEQDEEGHSFALGSGMIWGDPPADRFSDAIDDVREAFRNDVRREPTIGEIKAGLLFSLRGLHDEEPADHLDGD